eukprot:scaffold12357_cov91-Skeletonema_dohrnii-CCMP3373.AAC.4
MLFYVHTKDTQRYTTTLTSCGSNSSSWVCVPLRAYFRDFGRILLLPRGWERGIAMPICGQPSLQLPSATANRDSWRGSCAGVVELAWSFVGPRWESELAFLGRKYTDSDV